MGIECLGWRDEKKMEAVKVVCCERIACSPEEHLRDRTLRHKRRIKQLLELLYMLQVGNIPVLMTGNTG